MKTPDPQAKRRSLAFLAIAEVMAMSVWLSASAVVPQLQIEWQLNSGQAAWVTMSLQAGFVAGALGSAIFNIPDRFSSRRVFVFGALGAAACNAMVVMGNGFLLGLVARFATGVMLAGVYPPGMKIVATWTQSDRGKSIGVLVGAVTLGSAMPHLVSLMPVDGSAGMPGWERVLLYTSAMAAAGAVLVAARVQDGPFLAKSAPFDWKYVGEVLRNRPTRLANFGYLGHMWELYAVWVWAPILLLKVYENAGWPPALARLAGFGVVATGAVGCVIAGIVADRRGRTTVTIASLAISGTCCLLAGAATTSPLLFTVLSLAWGFAVVADSAQFSTAITELADDRYVGTALTLQTSMGFLLTLVSIRLVPLVEEAFGWGSAFWTLALGPVFGIWSMAALRMLPEAERMASGNR